MRLIRADKAMVIKYPYTLRQLRQEFPNVMFGADIPVAMLATFGVFKVAETARPDGDVVTEVTPVLQLGEWVQAWEVRDFTDEEKAARRAREVSEKQVKAREFAADIVAREQIAAKLDDLTDDQLDTVTYLYPEWSPDGVGVVAGELQRVDGVLYRCLQPHTTQADWRPPDVPALWARVRESGTEWFAGEQLAAGAVRTYQGVSYTVIQPHTTQVGWEPPKVPALWSED